MRTSLRAKNSEDPVIGSLQELDQVSTVNVRENLLLPPAGEVNKEPF